MTFIKGQIPWNKGKNITEKHKEKVRKANIGKKYSETTKEKHRILMSGEKNPNWKGGITCYERKLWLNNKRRALSMKASGSHTQGEWENLKAQYNWTCPHCNRKEPIIKLTVDHIIPLSKGGSHNIENIQPLCKGCNSRKKDKIVA